MSGSNSGKSIGDAAALGSDPRATLALLAEGGPALDASARLASLTAAAEKWPNAAEIVDALADALAGLGRWSEAIALDRRALALAPSGPRRLRLGNRLLRQGSAAAALTEIALALGLMPTHAPAEFALGAALRALERPAEAISAYRRGLALDRGDAQAWRALGDLLRQTDQRVAAEAAYRQAIAADPKRYAAHYNLGVLLQELGRPKEALGAYRQAIALAPDRAEANRNLGLLLLQLGAADQAAPLIEKALAAAPDDPATLRYAGLLASTRRDHAAALGFYDRALALQPDDPEALGLKALPLLALGRVIAAANACGRALNINPDSPDHLNTMGLILREMGRHDDSMVCLRRALALRPDHKAAQVNLGLGLMAEGDWVNGWRSYEGRWASGQYGIGPERFAKPLWDGKPLDGKKLFVWWEQGFGDTIQYLRFVEPALALAPHLVLSVQDALFDVARSLPWKALLTRQPLPEERFDFHAPLMSLPAILGLTAEAIAVTKPYLHARRDRVAYWRIKLADLPQPRIALVWQGSADNPEDRRRSMQLADLAPLFDLPVSFVSLQKGTAATAIAAEGLSGRVLDLDAALTDFAATAAILQSVDLLISVDSAVAHLAGAMGRPVWLALSDVPGPRWGLVEARTSWYRQTSLFRQTKGGDWSGPVGQMRAQLTERLAGMKVPGVSETA